MRAAATVGAGETRHAAGRRRVGTRMLAAPALALALALAACGGGPAFRHQPPPPSPVAVEAAIAAGHVVLSPDHVGAGQVELLVANETGAAQRVTLQGSTPGASPAPAATIGPGEVVTIDAVLARGAYTLLASGAAIRPARLRVGAPRPSAPDQLLTP